MGFSYRSKTPIQTLMQMCQDSNGVSHVGALQYAGQRADHMHIKCVSSPPLAKITQRARPRSSREGARTQSTGRRVLRRSDDREIDRLKRTQKLRLVYKTSVVLSALSSSPFATVWSPPLRGRCVFFFQKNSLTHKKKRQHDTHTV